MSFQYDNGLNANKYSSPIPQPKPNPKLKEYKWCMEKEAFKRLVDFGPRVRNAYPKITKIELVPRPNNAAVADAVWFARVGNKEIDVFRLDAMFYRVEK